MRYSLHQCYREIIQASSQRSGARGQMIDYAASYARHGLLLKDAKEPAELDAEQRAQALYVRTNLSNWRTILGKDVRASIDYILGKAKK